VPTRNGYSFFTMFQGTGGLRVKGLVAATPYRITPVPSALRH
jgi:hypothetical protein